MISTDYHIYAEREKEREREGSDFIATSFFKRAYFSKGLPRGLRRVVTRELKKDSIQQSENVKPQRKHRTLTQSRSILAQGHILRRLSQNWLNLGQNVIAENIKTRHINQKSF